MLRDKPTLLPPPHVPSINPRNKPSSEIDLSTIADDDPHNKFCLALDFSAIADDDPSKHSGRAPCAFVSPSQHSTLLSSACELSAFASGTPQVPSPSRGQCLLFLRPCLRFQWDVPLLSLRQLPCWHRLLGYMEPVTHAIQRYQSKSVFLNQATLQKSTEKLTITWPPTSAL